MEAKNVNHTCIVCGQYFFSDRGYSYERTCSTECDQQFNEILNLSADHIEQEMEGSYDNNEIINNACDIRS